MGPIEISPSIALKNYGVKIGDTIKITPKENSLLTDNKITELLLAWSNSLSATQKAADASDLYLDNRYSNSSQTYQEAFNDAMKIKDASFEIFQIVKKKHCSSMILVDLERQGY
ncbi:MAG: hypothetical protein H0V82_08790 [Candidatus Protochlamydia sp.]|nr:hypothetical protein [Candidatus Protochlamydia sp.]